MENSGLYSVSLTVKAQDLNALNGQEQTGTSEVVFYIQSYKESGPMFLNEGWNNIDKKIFVKINEEMEIGETVIELEAQDPETEEFISFEMEPADGFGLFRIVENKITVKDRIDYESIDQTIYDLEVRAISPSESFSSAKLTIEIVNINDNSPVFEKIAYKASVSENIKYPEKILIVKATDEDAVKTDRDVGYSKVKYSLAGPSAILFTIDDTGAIQLTKNQTLDREKQSFIKLQVIAEDSVDKPSEARKTSVPVTITILDVNDVAPKFLNRQKNGLISAVVSESAPSKTLIVNLETYDPDEGPSGEVRYEMNDEGEIRGLLTLNPKTGELKTSKLLTGRGRSNPYEVKIRAIDNGNQIPKQQSLFTDQVLQIFIGDTFNNDGIPYFTSPEDEEASVAENSPIGTKVYQIIAKDPDDPATPSGSLKYQIQNDIEDAKYFKIETLSGVITTTQVLDREVKDKYNIIVKVSDQGEFPQASTRVLKINVLDVDDEDPLFNRELNSKPIELMVLEEQSSGVILGNLTAIDKDLEENGAIDYEIIDGNEMEFFSLVVTNNTAFITTTKPIDREKYDKFLLTVKCTKKSTRWIKSQNSFSRQLYKPDDLSEIQVYVHVIDTDDHPVEFEQKSYMIGIRNTIPLNTLIYTVKAHDVDSGSSPILYQVLNTTFISQFSRKEIILKEDMMQIFELKNSTGEILLAKSVSNFVDGYFILQIRGSNNRFADVIVKIFIIRDKSIMKFTFSRPPMDISPVLSEFSKKLQDKLGNELKLSIFDAQLLSKPDRSFDFSSSSSCFLLFRNEELMSLQQTKSFMNSEEMKNKLRETYVEYSVDSVDLCSFGKEQSSQKVIMTSSGSWLVLLAVLVSFASFFSTIAACCLFKKLVD